MRNPIPVAVTGAGGQIAYNLLFSIGSGRMFGPGTPVILRLLDRPGVPLDPVVLELEDCAFPLLRGIVATDDPEVAFRDASWALLVGAKPRSPGQERKDLIIDNAPVFAGQARALEAAADDVRVLVVGNPCNTNCRIALRSAPWIPPDRWFALTRLDHNRARALLARKAGVGAPEVTGVSVWGNHGATVYPDFLNARIRGRPAAEAIGDEGWLREEFVAVVRNRGTRVIEARGKSSAASAAAAIVDCVRSLVEPPSPPAPPGDWTSAGVISDGSYGVPEGLVSSFPIRTEVGGGWEIVQGLDLDGFARARIAESIRELEEESRLADRVLEALRPAATAR